MTTDNQTTQPTGMLTPDLDVLKIAARFIKNETYEDGREWRAHNREIIEFCRAIESIVSQAYEARIAELEAQVAGYKLHMQRQGKSIAAHVFAALQSPTNIPEHIHLHAVEEKLCSSCGAFGKVKCNGVCTQPPTTALPKETPVNMSAVRDQFEAAFKYHKLDKDACGEYLFKYVQHAWEGWERCVELQALASNAPAQNNDEALRKAISALESSNSYLGGVTDESMHQAEGQMDDNNEAIELLTNLLQPANEVKVDEQAVPFHDDNDIAGIDAILSAPQPEQKG